MASNNLTMSLNLDPSNYLKRMQEVLGTTSARTKEGVTVALHLGLNKKEISNAKKLIDDLNGKSYTIGGKKYTIKTDDLLNIFENSKRMSDAYSTLGKRAKGLADGLLRLQSMIGDSFNRLDNVEFDKTTQQLNRRYDKLREGKIKRDAAYNEQKAAERSAERAPLLLQNRLDMRDVILRREQYKKSNDIQSEIAANKELISLLKQRARLSRDTKYLEQARTLRRRNEYLGVQLSAERERLRVQKESEKAAGNFEKALLRQNSLMRGLGSLASRYLNIFMISGLVQRVAEMTGYFQKQEVALEGILGSAAKANSIIQSIKIQALKSPFTTEQIVGNVKQIAAYGIPAEDLVPTAKMLGDLSSGLGVDMNRLILAYGQVKSAAVLRGQELRQFTEAGVPMVQKLADKFTELNGRLVTTGEVFELISKRQVSFEMVAEVLRDMTSEGGQFYNMQENVMETLYGQIGKLKDMWSLSLNDIGSTFGKTIMGVIKALQFAMQNFSLVLFTIIGKGLFGAIASPFKTFISTMDKAIKRIGVYKTLLLAVRRISWSAKFATFGISAAVNALSLALGILINKIVKANEFEKSMNKISDTFTKDAAKMVAGFDKLIGRIRTFPEESKNFKDAMSTILSNYSDYISESDLAKVREIKDLEERKKAWNELTESISNAIQARKMYEMHMSIQQESGDKAISNNISGIIDMLLKPHIKSKRIENNHSQEGFQLLPDFDKMYGKLRQKNVETAISGALKAMTEYGYTTSEKFKPILEQYLKSFNLGEDVINELLDRADEIIQYLDKTEEWKRYVEETETLAKEPNTKTKNIFNKASEEIANQDAGIIQRDIKYINAASASLENIASSASEIDAKKINDLANSIKNITEESWDAGKTESVAQRIYELSESIKDKNITEKITFLKNLFVDLAGTRTGVAATIATSLAKPSSTYREDFIKFAQGFIPTDENVETLRNNLISKYKDNYEYIKEHREDSSWSSWVAERKKENEYIRILGSKKLYDINFDEIIKGSGSSKGGYRQLFNEFFSLIKESKSEQDKLAAVTGLKDTFNETLKSLDKDNILRSFYEGGNPFQPVLDKIKEFGINAEGVFKDTDFSGLKAKYKDGLADYEALWDDLLGIINNKIEKGGINSSTKNALIAFRDQMVGEGKKFFGKINVESKIDEIIKSLGSIESNTENRKELYDIYKRLAEYRGYGDAGKIIYGEESYVRDNSVNDILAQLSSMLNLEGVGLKDYDTGIESLLGEANDITVNTIGQIYDVIENIKGITPIDENSKAELDKVKNSFITALKKLIESILEEDARINDAINSTSDNNAISAKKAYTSYKDRGQYIIENVKKEEWDNALKLNKRRLWNDLTSIVGGTSIPDYVKSGEDRKWINSNIALGGMSLQDILINEAKQRFADSDGGDHSSEKFIKEVEAIKYKIDRANLIMNSIKSISSDAIEATNSIVDAISATNGLKGAAKFDAAGNLITDNRYDKNKIEMAKTGLNVASAAIGDAGDVAGDIMSGNYIKAAFHTIKMIGNLIKNISEAIDKESDLIQESNDELIKQEDNWQSLYSYEENFVAGVEKWNKQMDIINSKLRQNEKLQENINLELQEKSVDKDYIESYQQQIIENNRAISETIKGIKEQILGTADELANTLGNAFVEAFRQGDNAARAWRDAFKSYIGDALSNLLIAKVIAPQLEELLDMYAYGFTDILDENGDILKDAETQAKEAAKKNNVTLADYIYKHITDPKIAKEFEKSSNELLTKFTDFTEALPKSIQDYLFYKSDSSSLSGGIQGITEDTARRLEAIGNSQLGEVFSINNKMSSIQSDIAKTASNVALIYALIDNMSKGVNRLHVTME